MLIFQGTDSLTQKMNPHSSARLDSVLLELESRREAAESLHAFEEKKPLGLYAPQVYKVNVQVHCLFQSACQAQSQTQKERRQCAVCFLR